MVTEAWKSLETVDMILVVIDASNPIKDSEPLTEMLKRLTEMKQKFSEKEYVLLVNKTDLIRDKETTRQIIDSTMEKYPVFSEYFSLSALSEVSKVNELRDFFLFKSRPGHWEYPEDQKTDLSDLDRVCELIREKIFRETHQELPYSITQENLAWTDLPDGSLRIDQIVFVKKISQRKMLIGTAGQRLRKIATEASDDISKIFQRRIKLMISVKLSRPNEV